MGHHAKGITGPDCCGPSKKQPAQRGTCFSGAASECVLMATRGRPRSASIPRIRDADQVIAMTVWQLLCWGYPLRRPGGIADVVSAVAREELDRTGHGRKNLGPDQIEKVLKSWMKDTAPFEGRPWQRIRIDSLRDRGPRGMTLEEAAKSLIRNKGKWNPPVDPPGEIGYLPGDPYLTRKAHAEYLRNRLRRVDPSKNGVNKLA